MKVMEKSASAANADANRAGAAVGRTVVTVLSTNYAGSHYLSLMLGSHSQAAHVGEIKHLARQTPRGRRCDVCDSPQNCPIVRNTTPHTVGRIYDTIHANLTQDGCDVPVLIDTSKVLRWASRFLDWQPDRMKYIHLIRDPRALVRRWVLSYPKASQRRHIRWKVIRRYPKTLLTAQTNIYAYNWLMQNRRLTDFLRRHGLDHRVVCYEGLTAEPQRHVDSLMRWIGVEPEPSQIEYWHFDHHGTQKREYEWVKQQGGANFCDTRWRDFLSAEVVDSVTHNRDINAYLAQLGLTIGDSGLAPAAQPTAEHRATEPATPC